MITENTQYWCEVIPGSVPGSRVAACCRLDVGKQTTPSHSHPLCWYWRIQTLIIFLPEQTQAADSVRLVVNTQKVSDKFNSIYFIIPVGKFAPQKQHQNNTCSHTHNYTVAYTYSLYAYCTGMTCWTTCIATLHVSVEFNWHKLKWMFVTVEQDWFYSCLSSF